MKPLMTFSFLSTMHLSMVLMPYITTPMHRIDNRLTRVNDKHHGYHHDPDEGAGEEVQEVGAQHHGAG